MKKRVSVVLAVFLLSSLVLASLVMAVTEYYGFKDIRAGRETVVHGTDETIPVQEISFVFNVDVKEAWLELQSFTVLPSQVTSPAEGNQEVYKYLHFRKSPQFVQTKLDRFDFELIVKKSWLEKHGVDLKTLVVKKYENDAWLPVDLKYLGEDDESVIYKVSTLPVLHAVLGQRGSNLPPNPEEGAAPEVEQGTENPVTGAAIADSPPQGYRFAWAILAVLIVILAILGFMYYTNTKKEEVFPRVPDTAPPAPEKEPEKKLFTVSDEELAKNREQVRKELGL